MNHNVLDTFCLADYIRVTFPDTLKRDNRVATELGL